MKLDNIQITPEQIISLQQSIFELKKLNNEKLVTCIWHLETLQKNMSKAKIINEGK
jgi:hypothetical protein|tara:strand:- start:2308 stop:2475 length:168 start_codon:yes stop_codon:yes gene_type:complete